MKEGIEDISVARQPMYTSDLRWKGLAWDSVMESFMDKVEVVSEVGRVLKLCLKHLNLLRNNSVNIITMKIYNL